MMIDEPLDGRLFGEDQPCFGCGPKHPHGFRLSFERIEDGVRTRFTPGEDHQGPISVMHGGLVSTLVDEVAAWSLLAETGKFGFTTQMQVKFRAPVRVGVELEAMGRLVKRTSRVVTIEVEVHQNDQKCCTAELKFMILDKAGAEALMNIELPEAWARFSR